MSLVEKLESGVETESGLATENVATELAALLPLNTVIALSGDLGAGKTTFIRGLARGWDITEPVTSPTFNLYTIYEGARQLVHLDAYRLSDGSDLDALMIDDFMKDPWCFAIEWPERIAESLPSDAWFFRFEISENAKHRIRLSRNT